ncbi:MAG: preprotein translocase subunit SecE [Planctomycetota bacterium]
MADHVQADIAGAEITPPPRTPPPVATGRGPGGEPRGERPSPQGVASPLRILKPGQGVHVRWATAAGAGLLAISAAYFIFNKLTLIDIVERNFAVRAAIPVIVLLASAWLIFWLVGRNAKVVDFLIATEGEMKKVNWSTRKEVWGATKVVIVTVLALAIILFVVDVAFIFFFSAIKILHFDVMRELFGVGAQS